VGHAETAQEDVAVEIHHVGASDAQLESGMGERHGGGKRVVVVAQVALPLVLFEPGKGAIHPKAGVAEVPSGVIALTDGRPIEIAEAIACVEVDQQAPVGERQIARHRPPPILPQSSTSARSQSGWPPSRIGSLIRWRPIIALPALSPPAWTFLLSHALLRA